MATTYGVAHLVLSQEYNPMYRPNAKSEDLLIETSKVGSCIYGKVHLHNKEVTRLVSPNKDLTSETLAIAHQLRGQPDVRLAARLERSFSEALRLYAAS